MTAFSTVTPTPAALDASKHVNFTLGMVLGVDDFGQEFAYHSGRDKWLARDLIGAGTVRGLGVSISADGTEVIVAPGVALTPQGELVRVPAAQCAVVADWLKSNVTAVAMQVGGGSPPSPPSSGTVTLYVVLRYKQCLTDPVPIPGEPCRSEADAMAASRVTDSFQLDLLLTPPAPTEEPGMRAVLAWLAAVPVVSGPGTATPAAPGTLVDAMRASFGLLSPSVSPSGTYPPPPPTLTFGAATVTTMYRIAMQLYATDLRDLIASAGSAAIGVDAVPAETGILLGVVHLPVQETLSGVWTAGVPTVDPSPTRPFLLPLDMLKEAWLASSAIGAAAAGSAGTALAAAYRLVAAGTVAIKNKVTDPDPAGIDPPLTPGLVALASQVPANVGDVTVTFPDSPVVGTRYVVNVLPIAAAPPWPTVTLKSTSTTPPGFTLHVSLSAGDPSLAQLTAMRLMIEVNSFVR